MLEIAIFYDKVSSPSGDPDKILSGLSQLESLDAQISIQKYESPSSEQKKKIVEEIRRIKPQSRGSVVASGGRILPISGSKKLNLKNTPVLLVREIDGDADSSPIYVFPCKVGERYYSVLDGIAFLSGTLPNLRELPGETEESLISSLKANSDRLESGLRFRSSEDTLTTGKTDLVFLDSRLQILLIEVERAATDSAIGQNPASSRRVRKRSFSFPCKMWNCLFQNQQKRVGRRAARRYRSVAGSRFGNVSETRLITCQKRK